MICTYQMHTAQTPRYRPGQYVPVKDIPDMVRFSWLSPINRYAVKLYYKDNFLYFEDDSGNAEKQKWVRADHDRCKGFIV